ncbi:MAG: signal peptide peptidase SppA [candidate division WOR-3 bacterium]|nr:signal peptide peptidase SppA [candidate division WOR-3 bacterium]
MSIFLCIFLISSSPLSVATTDDALAILANPAGLGVNRDFNFYYLYNFTDRNLWDNQSFILQTSNLGISYIDNKDFRISSGNKFSDGIFGGLTYRKIKNFSFWDAGIIIRPHKFISIGAVIQSIGKTVPNQYVVGIGVRPFSNRYTITCDAYSDNWYRPTLGIEAEPISGIEIKGKINTYGEFSVKAGISFGKFGLGSIVNSPTKKWLPIWSGYLRLNSQDRRRLIPSSKCFLEMKLSGRITDQKPGFSLLGNPVKHTTYEILNTIKKARDDKDVIGIVLKLDGPDMSFAIAQEIKLALDDFKKSNKKIIVYAPSMGIKDYYLVCGADEIITHPLGEVVIPGIFSRPMLLKGTLDKVGVEVDYERIGKYKSAPETFTSDSLSAVTREVINSILDDYYQNLIKTIANERKFSEQEIENKINQGFFSSKEAKENKLIDHYCYEDELDSILKNKFKNFKKISASKYNKERKYIYDWYELPKIALVYAVGDIMTGESSTDPLTGSVTCGANTIVKAIRDARKDKNVKAIVLRVDSPGGDGFASDLIWRELSLAKEKKPVVVSMGPVSASGGYYISMAGDKIFASPATITGSIGVFSLKFVTQGLYTKLGVKTETIKRGEHADMFSPDRKFTEQEKDILKRQIQDFYAQFINKVAQHRNLTPEFVDSVGQGRVWTGNQARQCKLVDSLGGLLNALDFAKEKAKVNEVKIEFFPKRQKNLLDWAIRLVRLAINQ